MLTNIIEALIFASGNGMTADEIHKGLQDRCTKKEVEKAVQELKKQYSGDKGIILIEHNKTLQFQSNPNYGEILADMLMETRERELSKTLLQVLAIVAYKQPVTRAEIEDLRGVNSDYVVGMLLKLDLIEAVGRKETVGRPVLYGTTNEFLRKFGLQDLTELPDYDELMHQIRTNFDKYYKKTEGLYREHTIDDTQVTAEDYAKEVAAAEVVEDDAEDEFFEEDIDEMPSFLVDEDIVEIE